MGTRDGGNAVFCRVGAAWWARLENRGLKIARYRALQMQPFCSLSRVGWREWAGSEDRPISTPNLP
jgi:hypothetical protein